MLLMTGIFILSTNLLLDFFILCQFYSFNSTLKVQFNLPNLCWIKVVRADILVLLPILEEMLLSFSPKSVMLAVGLSLRTFIILKKFPSKSNLWGDFIINGCWILWNSLCIYWDDHIAFILQFINMLYHID